MNISNFSDAAEYLGSKTDRPIANNTRLIRRDADRIAVRLHATDVVTYLSDGTAELQTGGWYSVTTKDRINAFTNARVFSDRGRWYLRGEAIGDDRGYGPASRVPFSDGVRIDADGYAFGPTSAATARETAAEIKRESEQLGRIRRYAAAFVEALAAGRVPVPSAGDCFYCAMRTSNGESLGDAGRGSLATGTDVRARAIAFDHLVLHMREKYFVPSLVVNAAREKGMRPEIWLARADDKPGLGLGFTDDKWARQQIGRAIVRYMARRLVPARPTK